MNVCKEQKKQASFSTRAGLRLIDEGSSADGAAINTAVSDRVVCSKNKMKEEISGTAESSVLNNTRRVVSFATHE